MKLWQILLNNEHYTVQEAEPTGYVRNGWTYRELPADEHELREAFLAASAVIRIPHWFPTKVEHHARPDPKDRLKIQYWNGRKVVSQKPGRYLTAHFPHEDVQALATRWSSELKPVEVLFAKTADEIERVYLDGPESCMAHAPGHYDSPFHPVRVYAGPDLAVAYIKRDDRITARCLVWPERLLRSSIYGDSPRLQPALVLLGYGDEAADFDGARLTLHEYGGEYVCPYIDGHDYVTPSRNHLVIDDNGSYPCDRQNGMTGDVETGEYCQYYEETRDEETSEVIVSGSGRTQMWSETAIENHASWCDLRHSYYCDDLATRVETGFGSGDYEYMSPFKRDRDAVLCDISGDYYLRALTVQLADGETWNREAWEEEEPRPELAQELEQAA